MGFLDDDYKPPYTPPKYTGKKYPKSNPLKDQKRFEDLNNDRGTAEEHFTHTDSIEPPSDEW